MLILDNTQKKINTKKEMKITHNPTHQMVHPPPAPAPNSVWAHTAYKLYPTSFIAYVILLQ